MDILILAAGYGTRLKTLAGDKPKGLMEIEGRPLVSITVDHLKNLPGVERFILVTNDKFHAQFEDWAARADVKQEILVINDGTKSNEDRLGSIGDIDFVLKKLKLNRDLIVVGSDNLFDFNLDEYLEFARAKGDHVTIGLYDIRELKQATQFGVVELGAEGKILSFQEKPAQPRSTLIAMCFYYLPGKSLPLVSRYLAETKKTDRAGDYIRWLCEKSQVYGFHFSGKWYDIGTIEAYQEAKINFNH